MKDADAKKKREKLKVAIFDFACCEGCQLQIVNLEEEILDLVELIQPVQWREAISDHGEDYDVAIIEGSITREQDEERLKKICERAKVVIALGACATLGGVNKIKENFPTEEVKKYVYGKASDMPHLKTGTVKAVHEVVKVDYKIHGCPISNEEFGYVVRCLAAGKKPLIPNYPVCVECKMRENVCRYEFGEVCLGVITRAGCNAPCPSAGFWCFGCRGFVDDPNVNAARDVMEKYNVSIEDLKSRIELFNTGQEPKL